MSECIGVNEYDSYFLSLFFTRQPAAAGAYAAVAAAAGGDGGIEANEKASNKRHSQNIYVHADSRYTNREKKSTALILPILKRKTLI